MLEIVGRRRSSTLSGRRLLVWVIAVVTAACGPAGEVRGTWTLDSMTVDGVIQHPVSGHPVTLVVDGSGVAGDSGCNDYWSNEAGIRGGVVSIPEVWTTLASCIGSSVGDDLQAFETTYQQALTRIDRYTINNDGLTLDGEDANLVFTLK